MAPSNSAETVFNSEDHRLPKSRILRSQQNFNRLFQRENVKIYRSRSLNFRFRIYPNQPEKGCKVGFIVKRRLGKAAYRNRVKRLMREVYRKNQHALQSIVRESQAGFHGAFSANNLEADHQQIRRDMRNLLAKSIQFIHSSSLAD